MNFLGACKILQGFASDRKQPFLLGMSGTSDQFLLYIKAYAAQHDIEAQPRTLSFGALLQTLFQAETAGELEIFVLFPWDFVPELDWRSGIPETVASSAELIDQALSLANRFKARPSAKFIYVPAPVLPIFSHSDETDSLLNSILGLALGLGAKVLSPDVFTLGGYLATGNPIRGDRLSGIAHIIWSLAAPSSAAEFKVLITDLDGVMWSGVIGEDGLDGIECGPEGQGYCHFLYQGLLRKLKASGVIIAAVSRNDMDLALAPFRAGKLRLSQDDFVAVVASYEAKSSQIGLLAKQLNLGLESFVFIDDNTVEIAEVSTALPEVTCIPFPKAADDIVGLITQISKFFNRTVITNEDRKRSDMYRRNLKAAPPSGAKGADIEDYLRSLDMKLTFVERGSRGSDRALQLINKTNQFNLNGLRLSREEFEAKLSGGARLFCGGLSDRTGNHGEVIACLVEFDGLVSSLIMSCRVIQRRLEYAFIIAVLEKIGIDLRFDFVLTDRNKPFSNFLDDPAFMTLADNKPGLNGEVFVKAHQVDRELFAVEVTDLDRV